MSDEKPVQSIIYGRTRREELLVDDYKSMNLARRYYNARAKDIQDKSALAQVVEYGKNIVDNVKSGRGLLFVGNPGVGKTWSASVLAKEARRWGFSVYIVSHAELQELRFADDPEEFQDGMSLWKRIQTVDMLVLDEFDISFLTDKKYGIDQLSKLLARRVADCKTTILCISFAPSDSDAFEKKISALLCECTGVVLIKGEDLRAKYKDKEWRKL